MTIILGASVVAVKNAVELEKVEREKQELYDNAILKLKNNTTKDHNAAIKDLERLGDWKDSREIIERSKKELPDLEKKEAAALAEQQKRKKKNKTMILAVGAVLACLVVFGLVYSNVIAPKQKLNKAMVMLDSGDYDAAYELLEELGEEEKITANKHDRAMALIDEGKYDEAYSLLEEIGDTDAIVANQYDRAVSSISSNDYVTAYSLLSGLNYKDSDSLREKIKPDYERAVLSNAQIGSTVVFGYYEQDNNTSTKDDIEWVVLDRKGNKVLLISKDCLAYQPYNSEEKEITWENCSLRKWLNNTFIKDAFNNDERTMISEEDVKADKNPENPGKDPGNDTKDKVFVLSASEAERYSSESNMMAEATEYAKANALSPELSYDFWWLRTVGKLDESVTYVSKSGEVVYRGDSVDSPYNTVRPAIWIGVD